MKITAFLFLALCSTIPAFGAETRVLLPVFLPEIQGAFGSRFVTELSIHGRMPALVHGVQEECPILCGVQLTTALDPTQQVDLVMFAPSGNPGRVVFVDDAAVVDFGLRVHDLSSDSAGAAIPVVPETDFFTSPFSLVRLPPVPASQFRTALRIYAFADTSVTVRVFHSSQPADRLLFEREVHLQGAGAIAAAGNDTRSYNPAVAELFNFMPSFPTSPARIEITPTDQPVWALVSITNNSSNEITVVPPSRSGRR